MKIEFLYILNCPWCAKTRELIGQTLKELRVKVDFKEILIDSDEKARKYNFVGSPTIIINGRDIQENVIKDECLPCEKLASYSKKITKFVKQECKCGCRIFFYKNKKYHYPPKGLIKETIEKILKLKQ